MMTTEIKPCPFCGERNGAVVEGETHRWCKAICTECGAQAGEVRVAARGDLSLDEWNAKCRDLAIEEWNKRAEVTTPPAASGAELPALPEPESFMFQHEETGLTQFVDAQQVEWGFEKHNRRWHRVSEAFTADQMRAYALAALASPQVAPAMVVVMDEGAREPRIMSWNEMAVGRHSLYTYPAPVAPAPTVLETCNCRWRGEVLVQQCELHQAWQDTLHERAEEVRDLRQTLAAPVQVAPAPTLQSMWEAWEASAVDIESCLEQHSPSADYFRGMAAGIRLCIKDLGAAAPMQNGAAADDARDAATFLQPADYAALARVSECLEDDEGYDVPIETMKRLAELGVVRRRTGSIYSVTSFGSWVLGTWGVLPLQTTSDANVPPSTPAAKPADPAEEQGS